MKIQYITLSAWKFEEMVAFYRDVLRLSLESLTDVFAQFGTEGTRFNIHARTGEGQPLRRHTVEIHFEVEDVDAAAEVLRARGLIFEQEPANMPWGTRQGSFRDPEGYAIEIVGPVKPGEPSKAYPSFSGAA